LGLALCKKIVENHNGEIYGVSTEGAGASFTLFFRLTQVEAFESKNKFSPFRIWYNIYIDEQIKSCYAMNVYIKNMVCVRCKMAVQYCFGSPEH
jgi:hypothetical protein